jgi:hypothetical protein
MLKRNQNGVNTIIPFLTLPLGTINPPAALAETAKLLVAPSTEVEGLGSEVMLISMLLVVMVWLLLFFL